MLHMFIKLTQFWVTFTNVRQMILHNNVSGVTKSLGLIFILRNYISFGIILLVWEALNMLSRVPILVLKIHLNLLFHIRNRRKRWVTTITFSIVHEIWAPHHNNWHELDVLILVIDIHYLHESAVSFRSVVCRNMAIEFSLDREILRIFLL